VPTIPGSTRGGQVIFEGGFSVSHEFVDVRCFGCKEWRRVPVRKVVTMGPRGHNRFMCLGCVDRMAVRESVRRVSNHLGQADQDRDQGRFWNE